MRPPFSVGLEPGLDRGVPWGRDLFTFVTSAASHMMRTLQKPRKNRPSKRQVNHRRFLHNMIQRKFADIEAANHRLASSLYSTDKDEDMMCTVSLDKPEKSVNPGIPLDSDYVRDPEKDGAHKNTNNLYKPSNTIHSDVIISKEKTELNHKPSRTDEVSGISQRKENIHKEVEFTSINFPKGDDSYQGRGTFQSERCSETMSVDNVSEQTQTTMTDSSFIQFEENTPAFFSPQLSPLSLDLCDFSILVCDDKPRTLTDATEGQLKDIINHLSVGNKEVGVSSDVDVYFESIFGRQGDAEGPESSNSFSEMENLHCGGADYPYHHIYHSQDDTLTSEHCQSSLHCTPEEELSSFRSSDFAQSQFSSSSSDVSITHQQTYNGPHQDLAACILTNCNRILNLTPFEGVAQSFSASVHHHENRPVSTPPPEDDWQFTDILQDAHSPDF